MKFTVALRTPFSLDYSLDSGQAFRWERKGESWLGVVGGGVLKVAQEGEALSCESSTDSLDGAFVRKYFRLDEDIQPILMSIMKDEALSRAVQEFYGLRLLRQEGWECLASFVLATNSNIPRIKKMVARLSSEFGEAVQFEGERYSLFPRPAALAGASLAKLGRCGLGYRAPFIKKVARAVERSRVDFQELSLPGYERARDLLLARLSGEKVLLGVGPKVADCVLLFSCGKDESFPIDVWIARTLTRYYPDLLGPKLRKKLRGAKVALTLREYQRVSDAARKHFGPYAGYAQQYLFMLARSEEPTSSSKGPSSSEAASA
jgi:N-glycosylase/DNA lyase